MYGKQSIGLICNYPEKMKLRFKNKEEECLLLPVDGASIFIAATAN